ncbi:hypothetical protein RBWH47_03489 [Rhodopirellula baltica WH47]|uniref:Uncharacterized protein n=1 Tax=Rhodopirellula baltica WH47 TaxID=991778 RepID=F2AMF2_RHOBT|nr:hypothetical protein RBWH47_03489 [Rhodopirellula baltica WH47]
MANSFPIVLDSWGDAPGYDDEGLWPTKQNAKAQLQKLQAGVTTFVKTVQMPKDSCCPTLHPG